MKLALRGIGRINLIALYGAAQLGIWGICAGVPIGSVACLAADPDKSNWFVAAVFGAFGGGILASASAFPTFALVGLWCLRVTPPEPIAHAAVAMARRGGNGAARWQWRGAAPLRAPSWVASSQ